MRHRYVSSRLATALLLLPVVGVGCGSSSRPPTTTMDSPSDMVAVRWCEYAVEDDVRYGSAADCEERNGTIRSLIAVANSGNSAIHLLPIDHSSPRFVDTDTGTPGVTGVYLHGPPLHLADTGFPGAVLAETTEPPALHLVDLFAQREVLRDLVVLPEASSALEHIPGTQLVVAALPLSRRLAILSVRIDCGGETARTDECELAGHAEWSGSVTLPGAPISIAATASGTVWVSMDGIGWLAGVAVAAEDLGQRCGGAPCIWSQASATATCIDGLDNDGDGRADTEDPSCYVPGDDEAASLGALEGSGADGVPPRECEDGVDNDGDGAADADDSGCIAQEDASEGSGTLPPTCANGLDDDQDGSIDSDDASCGAGDDEFPRLGVAPSGPAGWTPACSDGIDNDGDLLTDWPSDAGCYGPSGLTESTPVAARIGPLEATEEGDLLLAYDQIAGQILLFDSTTGERLEPNAGDPLHTGLGVPIGQRLAPVMAVGTIVTDRALDDGETIRIHQRMAWVASSTALIWTALLDARWEWLDANGSPRETLDDPRFRRADRDARLPSVGDISCQMPSGLAERIDPPAERFECDDDRVPKPRPIVPDPEGTGQEVEPYYVRPGSDYVSLPRRPIPALVEEGSGDPLVWSEEPDSWRTPVDTWTVAWEGAVPGTEDLRGVLLEGAGDLIEVRSIHACESGRNPCDSGLDISSCEIAQDLCAANAPMDDLCGPRIDLCALCPGLCDLDEGLCSAGVMPGDRVVLEPLASPPAGAASGACDGFLASADASDAPRLEYEITWVGTDRLRIAPLDWVTEEYLGNGETASPGFPATLPPAECFRPGGVPSPFAFRVVASGVWLVNGGRSFGHSSPFTSRGGNCLLRADASDHVDRTRSGVAFLSPWGWTLTLDAPAGEETWDGSGGTEFARPVELDSRFRGFRVSFSTDNGFRDRTLDSLAAAPSALVFVDSARGPRLVLSDEGMNFVLMYNPATYSLVGDVLP